ncbi:MAG TPA: 2-oxo acid dehydrogenase subunit E2, partial [Gammaproteobacteria bacterium]|nr:2-oxo acid dehydrogenase subunit E2 [Gammaproteobacteria bacterium]
IDALLALRRELNEALDDANVTVNDLLIKACASALTQVPDCNVQLHGSSIHRFRDADIAVAVALEGGLITPIIRSVNRKGVAAVSNEARELVTRAKAGTLKQEEFEGGTFTVSNLGMFGLKQFDAIINPPQCGILAVGAGEERVIVKDGEPEVATMLTLSLSLDHRVVDGALGARFLQALVRIIEHPGLMSA